MRLSVLIALSFGASAWLADFAVAQTARVETVWAQSVEASTGSGGLVLSSPVLYVGGGDIVIAGTEPGTAGKETSTQAWIERRGANGPQWRQRLDGLPPYPVYLEVAMSGPDGAGRSIVILTFQTETRLLGGEFGRILSIDLATGIIDRQTPLLYPRIAAYGAPDADDALHVFGAMRLASNEILIYGGLGAGPYRWWASLRKSTGELLWDVGAASRGYGEVRSARQTARGIELLVHAIAYTRDLRDRHLLVRLDRAGRTLSVRDLGSLGVNQFHFTENGGLIGQMLVSGQHQIFAFDAKGNAATVGPVLPGDIRLIAKTERWLVFDNDAGRHSFMALDGRRLGFPGGMEIPDRSEIVYFDTVDGRPVEWLLQQRCSGRAIDFDCRAYDLTLLRVEF